MGYCQNVSCRDSPGVGDARATQQELLADIVHGYLYDFGDSSGFSRRDGFQKIKSCRRFVGELSKVIEFKLLYSLPETSHRPYSLPNNQTEHFQ